MFFFLCGSVFPPHKQEVEVMKTESLGKLLPGQRFVDVYFLETLETMLRKTEKLQNQNSASCHFLVWCDDVCVGRAFI